MGQAAGWRWFLAWAFGGGLVVFSLLAAASIGFFFLPFAALAVWLVGRTARAWPELIGILAGAGAVSLVVAARSWDYNPCPEGVITLPPGTTSYSCGGIDPMPWLVAGIVLVVLGPIAYAVARRLGPPRLRLGKPLSPGEKVFLALVLVFAVFSLMALLGMGTSSGGSGSIEIEPARTVSEP